MQCIKAYAITVHQNQYIKYFLYGAFTKKRHQQCYYSTRHYSGYQIKSNHNLVITNIFSLFMSFFYFVSNDHNLKI